MKTKKFLIAVLAGILVIGSAFTVSASNLSNGSPTTSEVETDPDTTEDNSQITTPDPSEDGSQTTTPDPSEDGSQTTTPNSSEDESQVTAPADSTANDSQATTPADSTANAANDTQAKTEGLAVPEQKEVEQMAAASSIEAANVPDGAKIAIQTIPATDPKYTSAQTFLNSKPELKGKAAVILEINIQKDGSVLDLGNGNYKVSLPLTDNLKEAKAILVYRQETDNTWKQIGGKCIPKDGKFSFETDHFSTYMFVAAEADAASSEASATASEAATTASETSSAAGSKNDSAKTGDVSTLPLFACMGFGLAAIGIVCFKKRSVR